MTYFLNIFLNNYWKTKKKKTNYTVEPENHTPSKTVPFHISHTYFTIIEASSQIRTRSILLRCKLYIVHRAHATTNDRPPRDKVPIAVNQLSPFPRGNVVWLFTVDRCFWSSDRKCGRGRKSSPITDRIRSRVELELGSCFRYVRRVVNDVLGIWGCYEGFCVGF